MFRICIVAIILIKYCVCDPKKCELISFILHCGEEVEKIPKASEFKNSSIRLLDLNNCSKLRFEDGDLDGYETLEELQLSYIHMSSQRYSVPVYKFLKLWYLMSFTFSHSELTDDEMWLLPENLHTYNVEGNKYTRLDVSMCPHLITIYASNNKLENIPMLSGPLPPLVELYLKNNPLSNLTIEDIAPLCNLRVLELDIPPNGFLQTDFCECKRLSSWLTMFNINGWTSSCIDPPTDTNCDLNCTYIRYLRRNCAEEILPVCPTEPYSSSFGSPAAGIHYTPSFWNNTVITVVFAIIGFSVLTAFAFVIYRYNANSGTDELVDYQEEGTTDAEEAEEEKE